MEILPEVTDSPWHIVDKSKNRKITNVNVKPALSYVPAKGSKPVVVSKHVISDNEEPQVLTFKKEAEENT